MPGALYPPVPELGVVDVIPDTPTSRAVGGLRGRWHLVGLGNGLGLIQIREQRGLLNIGESRKTYADKTDRPDLDGIQQQPARRRHQYRAFRGGVGQRRGPGQDAHIRAPQLHGDGPDATPVFDESPVGVDTDGLDGLA
ncbi:Uncharacterised protein [Mycobacteroides abscessus subsp. abscessus]|nr:Uncharacterised protein [Mycobacteroides abscessus subsp. abscessus]